MLKLISYKIGMLAKSDLFAILVQPSAWIWHTGKRRTEREKYKERAQETKSLRGISLINNDSASKSLSLVVLTPAKEGWQAPAHRVDPGSSHDAQGFLAGHRPEGGQRPGDHHVSIHRNHHQCHHTADTKQGSTEGIQLTTWRRRGNNGLKKQWRRRMNMFAPY